MKLTIRNTRVKNYEVESYVEALDFILGPNAVMLDSIESILEDSDIEDGDYDFAYEIEQGYNVYLQCEGLFNRGYTFPADVLVSREKMAEYFIKNILIIEDKFYKNNLILED